MRKLLRCPQCNHQFADSTELDPAERHPPPPATPSPAEMGQSAKTAGSPADIPWQTTPAVKHHERMGRRTLRGSVLRWLALVFLLLVCATALYFVTLSDRKTSDIAHEKPNDSSKTTPATSGNVDWLAGGLARIIESSIVQIESGGPAGVDSQGCGFVVNEHGLVATNYHVVSRATAGRVRFKNGVSYEIDGYAGIQRDSDLAILKLRDAPAYLQPLPLVDEGQPSTMSDVIAVGHPRGLAFSPFDGKVSRVLKTSQLPDRSREFLAGHMKSRQDHLWIQHTAVLSDGNSGGPLLNARGEVIGMNTWVDQQTGYGYAIGAIHVLRLLDQLLPATVPLEELATEEARVHAQIQRLSVEQMARMYEEAKSMNWAPRSSAQYDQLQRLAWSITVARFPASLDSATAIDRTLFEDLIKQADRLEARLLQDKWDAFAQVTIINEHAIHQIDRPSAGVFFFGTVQRVVSGDKGSRGMVVQLAGFNQTLFVPLDGILLNLPPKTHCLILGINQNGRRVQYGDNPLKLVSAPVIASRTILPIQE